MMTYQQLYEYEKFFEHRQEEVNRRLARERPLYANLANPWKRPLRLPWRWLGMFRRRRPVQKQIVPKNQVLRKV